MDLIFGHDFDGYINSVTHVRIHEHSLERGGIHLGSREIYYFCVWVEKFVFSSVLLRGGNVNMG